MSLVEIIPLAIKVSIFTLVFALALAPLPPIRPGKITKAGGDAYAISLLVSAALFAIVSIPLSLEVVGCFFGQSLHVGPLPILKLVLITVILPLLAGLAVRRLLPTIAASSATRSPRSGPCC